MSGGQRCSGRSAVGGRRTRGLPLLLAFCLCAALLLGTAPGVAIANTPPAPAHPAPGAEGATPAAEGDGGTSGEGGHTGGAGADGAHGGGHGLHPPLCDQPITDCLLSIAPPPCKTAACHSQLTVLIFPFLALIFGIILQPLVGLLRLPYTLLLLLVGALLGAVGCATGLGMLTRSLRRWVHLEPPTVFFFVFLAPLIFEAAYNTEWHVFKRLLIPIVTLAFVIVILQVFAVAAFQLYVLRTAFWNWWTALMFGAMLSATDPISVTATLKSAGASELLNVMIEGESLLNDGSAFVLWEAFFANAKAVGAGTDVESAIQIVVRVLRLSLGGVAMGLVFGLVYVRGALLLFPCLTVPAAPALVGGRGLCVESIATCCVPQLTMHFLSLSLVLSRTYALHSRAFRFRRALLALSLVYEAFEVETSVLLVVAFLGFWTAQVPAIFSGVICNVTSGLVLSAYARPLISPSVRDPLHHLWEYIAWAANTIVFVYAGVLVTAFTWSCSGSQHGWRDYVYIFIWFGFLQLIRFFFLAAFHPLLSWRQRWFTPRHSIFVGLSGLRGAVSLILALEVAEAADLPSEVKSRVVLWTTGIVALSLLVNGLAVSPALSGLGLAKADATRVTFLARARSLMTQKSLAILDTLAVDGGSKATRWSYVRDNVLPSSWLDSSTVDDYVRASIDMRGAMSADVRKSLDIHALNQRMGTAASADMQRSHTTRYGSALPADRDRPEESPLGSTAKGDRFTPSLAPTAGGGRFTPPPGASSSGDRFSSFHASVGGGGAHLARGTGIWGERTPQVSLDIPRRGGAVQMGSSGIRPAPGARHWGTDLHVPANSPLFLSNLGQATPREPGEGGAFHLDGSTASVQQGPHVRNKKKGRGSAGDSRGGEGRQGRFPGLPIPGRGGSQNGRGGPQDNFAAGAQAAVLGRVSGAWDTMRRGVARVTGTPAPTDIFADEGRAPNRTRQYAEDSTDSSVESSADVSAEPTYPVSLLSPQRPFRPQFRQQHRTLSGVFREVQRIHDSRSYRVDVGTELDREVRRRVLMAMLSCVRTSFNVSLVDWSALAALSEDLLHALDANEERRPYNLFANFLGRSFLGKFRVLRKAVSFAGSLFGRTGIESSVAVTSVVVEATTQVLKESWLTESPAVLAEVEQLYDSAVTFLSRLETMDPYHFSCVQTDSTVRLVFHKQEQTLDELREDGAIDAEEFSQLASELSAIRSHYFLVVDRLRRPSRHQSAREVLRRSPLFAQVSDTTFNRYVAQPGRFEELNVGDVVDQRGGAFLFVCQGALRVGAASLLAHRRQQRLTTNLTKAGIPLAMQSSFIEHTHAGEDAETAALHAGVLPRASRDVSRRRRTRHQHHSSSGGDNGTPRAPQRASPSPPPATQAEETPTSEEMDSPPLWPSNPPEPMPALASLGSGELARATSAGVQDGLNAKLPSVDGLADTLDEGNTVTSGGAEQSGSASSPYSSDGGSGSDTLSQTDLSGVVDYAAAEAAVRAFDDGEDDDLDVMFEPFSPPNRPPPTPASPAYARRVSMAGRADPSMRIPMGPDGGLHGGVGGGGGGGGDGGDQMGVSVGGRSSLQLSTGASMHFCLPRHHLFCGPAALIAVEDIDPSSPRGRLLQSQATAQAVALQFCACETAGEATVFWLPVDALCKLCEEVPAVRNEVARAVARLLVLDGLVDVPPYALAHTRDAVASSVPFSEDPSGGRGGGAAALASGGDVVLRATHTLAQLPYMSMTRVPPEGITVNGPGVLLVGQLRVTVVDTTGWAGVSLTHNLDAPALLPPGALILDRLDSGEEDNGASAGDSDGADYGDVPGAGAGVPQADIDAYMIQARRRRRHTRRRARRVVVVPEVLVDAASSVEDVASARLNRWTGPPVTVDANGRFGAFPHVDYNTVAI